MTAFSARASRSRGFFRARPAKALITLIFGATFAFVGFWPAHAEEMTIPSNQAFGTFLQTLWPQAHQAGISRATFNDVTSTLVFDPQLRGQRAKQSEFVKPLKTYLDEAASPTRATKGRSFGPTHAGVLRTIAERYGVQPDIALALWGLESDYGTAQGDHDIVRALATLAYLHPDNPVYAKEWVDALKLLEKGVSREQLRGSWAGAMGNPQFMPSAYLAFAVPFSGDGPPDIWSNPSDTLASIANFLKQSGWHPNLPPVIEVRPPSQFDYASLQQDFSVWRAQGFVSLRGDPLPENGKAMLFFPEGAKGPAFLLSENFFVLKAYNFSDSYAMAGAILADRIADRTPLKTPWPDQRHPLNQSEREEIQRRLSAFGLYNDKIDGRFGPVTRLAIHAWQRRTGIQPADGWPSYGLLQAMREKDR